MCVIPYYLALVSNPMVVLRNHMLLSSVAQRPVIRAPASSFSRQPQCVSVDQSVGGLFNQHRTARGGRLAD